MIIRTIRFGLTQVNSLCFALGWPLNICEVAFDLYDEGDRAWPRTDAGT